MYAKKGAGLTPQNYTLDGLEVYASATHDGTVPVIHLASDSGAPQVFNAVTVNVNGLTDLPAGSIGVLVETSNVNVKNSHAEHVETGLKVGLSGGGAAHGFFAYDWHCNSGVKHGLVVDNCTDYEVVAISNTSALSGGSTFRDPSTLTADYTAVRLARAYRSGNTLSTAAYGVEASGANGGIYQMANVKLLGSTFLPRVTSLPATSSSIRDRVVILGGTGGVPDVMYHGRQNAAGTGYEWVALS